MQIFHQIKPNVAENVRQEEANQFGCYEIRKSGNCISVNKFTALLDLTWLRTLLSVSENARENRHREGSDRTCMSIARPTISLWSKDNTRSRK